MILVYTMKKIDEKQDKILNKISIEKLKTVAQFNIAFLICSYLIIFFINLKERFETISYIWITMIYISGLLSFITYFLYKYKTKEKNKSNKFIYTFIILIIISTFFSSNIGLSIMGNTYRQEGIMTYLVYLSLFLNCTIINDKNKILTILKVFSIVGCILSLTSLIGYYFNLHLRNIHETYRPFMSIFYNENHAAYYYMMTYIASILLFYFSEKKNSYIFLASSIIILHNLILNNTLGCILSIIICLIILLIYTIIKKKYLIHFITIISMFIIVCILNYETISLNLTTFGIDLQKIETSIETNDETKVYSVGSNRIGLWKYGIQFMFEKPLFGYGNENLLEQYNKHNLSKYTYEETERPHNEFIQIGAFFGIPALIVYLCFLFSSLFPILKRIKTIEPHYVITSLICVSYLISSFFGVSCFYTTPFLYIFLGITNNYRIDKIKKKCYNDMRKKRCFS